MSVPVTDKISNNYKISNNSNNQIVTLLMIYLHCLIKHDQVSISYNLAYESSSNALIYL